MCCVVSLLALRRGVWRIMRSICRCVRLSRFSRSPVIVQASLAYNTVGVIVPWNSRRRSDRQYLGPVSSCFRAKNFFDAVEMWFSISVLCGSPKFSFRPKYLVLPCVGKISTVMSLMVVWLGMRRRFVVQWSLWRIFVLSGCSCKPQSLAASCRSSIILRSCA